MMRRWLAPVALVALFVWAWIGLDIDLSRLGRAASALADIADEFWPPDFSQFGPIWQALIETIQIAVLATGIGVLFSLPLGLVSARNLFPRAVTAPARWAASAVRVLPSILWAVLAVIVFGPGPLAGVVAMSFYTIGYLAKLHSEAFEGIPRDAVDAVRSMGHGRPTVAWHVALPEAANALRSQVLFMLEYNIRSSSVIGFVGAGGLGQLVNTYLQFYDYARVNAVLITLFVTVLVIDALSYAIRKRFIELENTPRPRWRNIFWPAQDK